MTLTGADVNAIAALDAVGQAEAVASRDLLPRDLVEAAISRITLFDPAVGALVHRRFDAARAEVGRVPSEAAFAGVPILLKDSLTTAQMGIPYFAGSRVLKSTPYMPPHDSPVGSRLRQSGFVTVGVAKMPELAWMTTTQPLAFGPTRNPWNPDYSVGGSSGGSAAAVASGMVPVATAVENGGSIRMPASFCGVVGLKPTRGLVPLPEPHIDHMLHAFAVTRTVRDAAALLDILSTSDPRSLFSTLANGAYSAALGADLPKLRVGVARTMGGVEAHADCQRAVDEVIRVLEQLGCVVAESMPRELLSSRFGEDEAFERFQALVAVRQLESLAGRSVSSDDVEPFTFWAARPDTPGPPADELWQTMLQRRAWGCDVLSWWDDHDILLCPTVCEPPVTIASRAAETPAETATTEARQMAFTAPFNETGQPAISLPLSWSATGLPIGVQLVADAGQDSLLLNLSAHLETLLPWSERRPHGS